MAVKHLWTIAACALGVCGLLAPMVHAQSGKIAFVSGRDGNWEIYAMNPDGSNPTRLTTNGAWDFAPAFSPDGSKIAFQSDRDGGTYDIYVMNTDYLRAERPPGFYDKVKPLLNVGAMMAYPRGAGGLLLCNVRFLEREAVPENKGKKQTILATLLRNLRAPFSGGKTIIAGTNLDYHAVDLSKQANAYRTDKGWFGDKAFTFADLPTGKHVFAGVPYEVYDLATSPVPTAVLLGGRGVPNNLPTEVTGIPVGRKADALFFLQTARLDVRRNADELRRKIVFELAKYVVHYADGKTAEVPVRSELDVDSYKQARPPALPGAQIAWDAPYAGTEFHAVAYSMQWTNPRPDAVIATIDLVYGKDGRVGVPALLAITAASAP